MVACADDELSQCRELPPMKLELELKLELKLKLELL